MVLLLDQFRNNFGAYPVPRMLEDLLAFQNSSNEWYTGGFELDEISQGALKAHIKEERVSQFLGFGHDANYSLYALWRYQEMPLEEAPIVYLNSEGQGSTVFANNLAEFFILLAWDEEPIFGKYSTREDDIEHTPRNQAFRRWLAERYHLQAASEPNEIVRKARLQHPQLPLRYTDE